MAWIFPKIEMGLFKWTCLIICFDFIYADVTQQPQEWILHQPLFSSKIAIFEKFFAIFEKFANRKRRIEGQFCRF